VPQIVAEIEFALRLIGSGTGHDRPKEGNTGYPREHLPGLFETSVSPVCNVSEEVLLVHGDAEYRVSLEAAVPMSSKA
jgi:hypothetical protein